MREMQQCKLEKIIFSINSHLSHVKILKTDHTRSYLMQKDNLFLLNERPAYHI